MSAASAARPTGSAASAVLVVTDDGLIHRRIAQLLSGAGFTCAAGSAPGDEDLIVVPGDGDAAARAAAVRELAERCSPARLIACMPDETSGPALRKALHAGAHGIVLDGELEQTLVPTVRAVAAGQLAVPLALRRHVAPRALSFREKQVLGLVVQGYTNRQIARHLFLAESTVKTHLSSAFDKLDTRSRAEAAALVLDPDEGYGMDILHSSSVRQDDAA